MNLCSSGHEEICYDSIVCPMCELLIHIVDLEKEVEDLKEELDNA